MRNFARINNYYNRIESIKDWREVMTKAIKVGIDVDKIIALRPRDRDGWRKIDMCTAKLKLLIIKTEVQQ